MREYNYSLLLTCRIVTVNFFDITLNDMCLTIPSWGLTHALLVADGSDTYLIKVVRLSADGVIVLNYESHEPFQSLSKPYGS